MKKPGADDLVALAEAVARGLSIAGVLKADEAKHKEAPFGEFAYTDIRLTSTERDSCPITMSIFEEGDAAGYVTVSSGASNVEVWGLSHEETIRSVRRLLAAIMSGNYEEWRSPTDNGRDDAYGVLTGVDGTVLLDDLGQTTADALVRRGYVRKRVSPY